MSHRSPFTTRPRASLAGHTADAASTSSSDTSAAAAPAALSSSYSHLHTTLHDADSSSDDEIDPRWTHPKVRAAAAASPHAGKSRREGAITSERPLSRSNFTRAGFAPTPSPLDSSYLNTAGTTGRTAHDATSVHQSWARGGSTLDEQARAEGDTSAEHTFSGIPQPNVDLTGMTDEQRELLEYLQARVGQ
jgi:hypothetical protein